MKKFRKTKEGLFVCEECERIFKNLSGLSQHINYTHSNIKNYYDKWLKENNEGKCKICSKPTDFIGLNGYKLHCSTECIVETRKLVCKKKYGVEYPSQSKEIRNKSKKTWIEKYGVDNPNKNSNVRNKIKKTNLEKYGVDHPWKSKEIREKTKQFCLKKYGVDNPSKSEEIKEKIKNTNLEKYNVENPFQNEEIKEKIKETFINHYGVDNNMKSKIGQKAYKKAIKKKYGVENVMQDPSIFEKAQKTSFKMKQFKNTDLYYQGSYELDFLEKYYDKFADLKRGPTIKYELNEKKKVYYPDFYIPSLNLIIEIKNSYLSKKYKKILIVKEKAVKLNKFHYIMIIDKNYSNFNNFIQT